jgi:hypothetical protein
MYVEVSLCKGIRNSVCIYEKNQRGKLGGIERERERERVIKWNRTSFTASLSYYVRRRCCIAVLLLWLVESISNLILQQQHDEDYKDLMSV